MMTPAQWKSKYAWLVSSNRAADDSVYLRAALLDPHLDILLDALEAFGLDRFYREWDAVHETERGEKVRKYLESMLRHFAEGVLAGFSAGEISRYRAMQILGLECFERTMPLLQEIIDAETAQQDRAGVAIEPQAGPEPDDDEPHKGHSR